MRVQIAEPAQRARCVNEVHVPLAPDDNMLQSLVDCKAVRAGRILIRASINISPHEQGLAATEELSQLFLEGLLYS